MKISGIVIIIGLVLASVSIIMKSAHIAGGSALLFLSLSVLSLLVFLQAFSVIGKLKGNIRLISVFISLTLSIAFPALLFRYMFWPGWSAMLTISTYLFLVISIVFVICHQEILTNSNKRFVWINLLLPLIWVFVFGAIHYSLTEETFYNTFSALRSKWTYQQYLDETASQK